jgi:hypothetical protein
MQIISIVKKNFKYYLIEFKIELYYKHNMFNHNIYNMAKSWEKSK